MQFAQRQRPSWERLRPFLAAIPLGLFLGFLGPYGSNPAYPTATRYAFWLGLTLAGAAAAVAADATMGPKLRAGAVRSGAVALVSALPMTFVVAWAMSLLQPGRFFVPEQLPALFVAVAAVQLLVVYATAITGPPAGPSQSDGPQPAVAHQRADQAAAAFPSVLTDRLPPEIGTEITALETEDHYLRVHTAEGSALILMRMADAVALLDPKFGARVHRRWWVADAAVTSLGTNGQKLSLRLVGDRIVPVGRTFSAAAKTRFGPRTATK